MEVFYTESKAIHIYYQKLKVYNYGCSFNGRTQDFDSWNNSSTLLRPANGNVLKWLRGKFAKLLVRNRFVGSNPTVSANKIE